MAHVFPKTRKKRFILAKGRRVRPPGDGYRFCRSMKLATAATSLASASGLLPESEVEPLNVAVVYSDRLAAAKVMEIHEHIIKEFRPGCVFRIMWWDADSLKADGFSEISRRYVAEADMVFVAIDAAHGLRPEVRSWLGTAMAGDSERDRVLLSVLRTAGEPPEKHLSVDDQLREEARRARMDYFAYWYQPGPVESRFVMERAAQAIFPAQPKARVAPKLEAIPRWGINE